MHRFRVTTDDLAILHFLGRHRFATVDQLSRRFARSSERIRRRRLLLAQAGYVTALPVRPGEPWLCLPTLKGIRLAGLPLPGCDYTPVTHDHTLGCVDIAIDYELRGATVITDREARSPAMSDQDWSLPTDQRRRIYPDLILIANGQMPEAVELELNAKDRATWVAKLDAYRQARIYGQVTYWIPPGSLAVRFARVVEGEGLDHLVRIRHFTPSQPSLRRRPA